MHYFEIISDIFDLDKDSINDDLYLQEIESWDSMNHMQLIAGLEDEYKIIFTGDEIADIKKIGDIKNLLIKKEINL